jgi:hypothetical protein
LVGENCRRAARAITRHFNLLLAATDACLRVGQARLLNSQHPVAAKRKWKQLWDVNDGDYDTYSVGFKILQTSNYEWKLSPNSSNICTEGIVGAPERHACVIRSVERDMPLSLSESRHMLPPLEKPGETGFLR